MVFDDPTDYEDIMNSAVLALTNVEVDRLNALMLEKLPTRVPSGVSWF